MNLDHDPPIRVLPDRPAWDGDDSGGPEPWLVRLAPRPGDVIAELGCGDGERAIAIKQAEPRAVVFALESDVDALVRAEIRARDAGAMVHFLLGALADTTEILASRRIAKLVIHESRLAHVDLDAVARGLGIRPAFLFVV